VKDSERESLFSRARGFVLHCEAHLERGNLEVLRETLPELRQLLEEIDRPLDSQERRRLRILPGRPTGR
jgi:hypothetical protein